MFDAAPPAVPSLCVGCHEPLPVGVRFCRHCGRSVLGVVDALTPTSACAAEAVPVVGFDARWNNLQRVAWLFGLLLATSLFSGMFEHRFHSAWVTVVASAIDALLILGFAIVRRDDVGRLFALPQCDLRAAWMLLLLAVGFVLSLSAYFDLLKLLGIPLLAATREFRDAGWSIGAMILLVCVMPGIFEEIGFRGVIQTALERAVDRREAWLIQAALFSVLHLSPIMFPSHFVMGLVFGYLRLRTRSLYPGMMLHAGWNALQVLHEI